MPDIPMVAEIITGCGIQDASSMVVSSFCFFFLFLFFLTFIFETMSWWSSVKIMILTQFKCKCKIRLFFPSFYFFFFFFFFFFFSRSKLMFNYEAWSYVMLKLISVLDCIAEIFIRILYGHTLNEEGYKHWLYQSSLRQFLSLFGIQLTAKTLILILQHDQQPYAIRQSHEITR